MFKSLYRPPRKWYQISYIVGSLQVQILLAVSVYCIFVVSLPSSVCQDILDLTLLLL